MYSRKQISRAGEALMTAKSPEERNEALQIINDWRSNHVIPLLARKTALLRLMDKNDLQAIILSQRLKRLTSIEYKLDLNPQMGLGGMQDIGGYRAVVKDVKDLAALYSLITAQRSGHRLIRTSNYIKEPKASGYRSIHFVYEYSSKDDRYNNLKLELQIRTKLQHNWATAVRNCWSNYKHIPQIESRSRLMVKLF